MDSLEVFARFPLGNPQEDWLKNFLKILLGAPEGDLQKTKGFLYVFAVCPPGRPQGNQRIPLSFRWVRLGRPRENLMSSLSFRWVLPKGAWGKKKTKMISRFSLRAPQGEPRKQKDILKCSLAARWVDMVKS